MSVLAAPGREISHTSTLPPLVAEAATAVPAFVGYTETATRFVPGDLIGRPIRIDNLAMFEVRFGKSPCRIDEVVVEDTGHFVSAWLTTPYLLHLSVRLFFANGGGVCEVLSVGSRPESGPDCQQLLAGIHALATRDELTLLLCPDAAQLPAREMACVQQAMLRQCSVLQDRFAVLDTRLDDPLAQAFCRHIGQNALREGAAYTPWLLLGHGTDPGYAALRSVLKRRGKSVRWFDLTRDMAVLAHLQALESALACAALAEVARLQTWLESHFDAYRSVVSGVLATPLACPPSGAVAGVYAAMDAQRGVWRAPANVAVLGATAPAVALNAEQASALNVDVSAGKSVNAIRTLANRGLMIWGARTLAGQDAEWRYVSVRRFVIHLQTSLKKAIDWVVFEPNDAATWTRVRDLVGNYLLQKWHDGALLGATPEQAFFVRCGLHQTMTALDVRAGRLIVELGLAVLRPAEFITLRLEQQTQRA